MLTLLQRTAERVRTLFLVLVGLLAAFQIIQRVDSTSMCISASRNAIDCLRAMASPKATRSLAYGTQ